MNDLVSVIVPVYNAENYIRRCANSILNQTHRNIELILVNDGSKDNSLSLCLEIALGDSRVTVIDKENGGAASARNRGLDFATGDYIGFCDADDYIDSQMYEDLLNQMVKNHLYTIECTSRLEDINGKEITRDADNRVLSIIMPDQSIQNIFLRKGNVSLAVRLTKANVIKNIRIPEGKRVEDFFFTILLLRNVSFNAVYNYPYYCCCESVGSVTRSATGSIYLDALYFYDEALKILDNQNTEMAVAQIYYRLKMYYLFSISMTKDESRKYTELIHKYQYDIRKNMKTMVNLQYLTKKEKLILLIDSFSMNTSRRFYKFKEKLLR